MSNYFVVDVFCEEESHGGRRTKLHQFRVYEKHTMDTTPGSRRSKAAVEESWHEMGFDAERLEQTSPDVRSLLRPIDRERGTSKGGRTFFGDGEQRRPRFEIRCPVCGLALVGRGENVQPILLKLRDSGVASISLRALAARLS